MRATKTAITTMTGALIAAPLLAGVIAPTAAHAALTGWVEDAYRLPSTQPGVDADGRSLAGALAGKYAVQPGATSYSCPAGSVMSLAVVPMSVTQKDFYQALRSEYYLTRSTTWAEVSGHIADGQLWSTQVWGYAENATVRPRSITSMSQAKPTDLVRLRCMTGTSGMRTVALPTIPAAATKTAVFQARSSDWKASSLTKTIGANRIGADGLYAFREEQNWDRSTGRVFASRFGPMQTATRTTTLSVTVPAAATPDQILTAEKAKAAAWAGVPVGRATVTLGKTLRSSWIVPGTAWQSMSDRPDTTFPYTPQILAGQAVR